MAPRAVVAGAGGLLVAALLPTTSAVAASGDGCEDRNNKTYEKLLECVTGEGVREHLEEFQKIADNSDDPFYPGTRAAGTVGYADSVDYVVEELEKAGYEVTLDPVEFEFMFPVVVTQLTPDEADYESGAYRGSEAGEITGQVVPVDINVAGDRPPPAGARPRTSPASTSAVRPTSP